MKTTTTEDPLVKESSDKTLARNTLGAMTGVFLSRFSGLIRQQIISVIFGATIYTDAFYVAFRYPNALRDLLADGALSSAFTKSLVQAKIEGMDRERKLISNVFAFFGIVTLALAGLGFIFAKEFMALTTAANFKGLTEAAVMFQMLVFYLPLTMLSASAMAILGVHNQTFRATFASSFFNLGTIFGALLLAPLFEKPIYGMAIGALIGGFLQFIFQSIPLYKLNLLSCPSLKMSDLRKGSPLREIFSLMGPRVISQGAMILALFINTLLATNGKGNVTYISNAQTIILVPVGLFGVASGFSSLPLLTEAFHNNNSKRFVSLLAQSLNITMWLAFFSIFAFSIAAFPFSSLLFGHGNFKPYDAYNLSLTVSAYSIGILFNSMSKIIQQGFFALGHTRQVVINSLVYLCINATCSWFFSRINPGPTPFGFSNSLAAAVDFTLNIYFLNKICKANGIDLWKYLPENNLKMKKIIFFSTSVFVLGGAGLFVHSFSYNMVLSHFPGVSMFIKNAILLVAMGIIFACISLPATLYFGPEPLKTTLQRIKKRLSALILRKS